MGIYSKTVLISASAFFILSCVAPKTPKVPYPEQQQEPQTEVEGSNTEEASASRGKSTSGSKTPTGVSLPPVVVKGRVVPVPVAGTSGNIFQAKGEQLLDKIITNFRVDSQRLYAEAIDRSNKKIDGSRETSFLWPGSHIIRAFRAAAMVNPKHLTELRSYSAAIERYKHNGILTASIDPASDPYYDDNAIIGESLLDAARRTGADAKTMELGKLGIDICFNLRDANWGVPQIPKQLGWGMYYSQTTILPALGAVKYALITNDPAYLKIATEYYERSKNPATGLVTTEGLYNQYSFITGGKASLTSVNDRSLNGNGLRAYQSTSMAQLALMLSIAHKDKKYLQDAQVLARAILNHWYKPGQGFNEISYWGGSDTVEMLLDLYEVDQDPKWIVAARDIVNDLLARGEDKRGYFASSADTATGNWNVDRRNMDPDRVDVMGQAAAATALFKMAYCDLYCPAKVAEANYVLRNALSGKVLTHTAGGVTTAENTGSKDQLWRIYPQDDGSSVLKAVSQDKYLGSSILGGKDGTTFHGSQASVDEKVKFLLVDRGEELFRIIDRSSRKALDAGPGSVEDKAAYAWSVADVPNQYWTIEIQK